MESSCKASSVIAGCFGPSPERDWLADHAAIEAEVSVTFVERRAALVGRARALRPSVVLLPLRDAIGLPSAPLIARLRARMPSVRVMVLLAPGTTRIGIAETIRAGGELAIIDEATELRAVLDRSFERLTFSLHLC